MIRPDNLAIHHEVLNQPLLRRGGLLEVFVRAVRQHHPLVPLRTREPADPVDPLGQRVPVDFYLARWGARGRSFCGLVGRRASRRSVGALARGCGWGYIPPSFATGSERRWASTAPSEARSGAAVSAVSPLEASAGAVIAASSGIGRGGAASARARGSGRGRVLCSFVIASERRCSFGGFARPWDQRRGVGRVARGRERRCSLHRIARSVVGRCVGKELPGTIALCEGLLVDELVGETARFRAETVAPARDLAEGVVASLQCARLRYIEGLVILKSGSKPKL